MKILLYRPILSQTLRNSNTVLCSESNDSIHNSGIHSRVNLDCSIYCVNAAINLISLVHQTCNTDLSSVWCYNVFCEYLHAIPDLHNTPLLTGPSSIDAFTAGSVIILAGLSQSLVDSVTWEALEQSWQKCQSSLDRLRLYSSTAERCAENLCTIKERCSITFPHVEKSSTNIFPQEQSSPNQSPTLEQLDNDRANDLPSEGTDYLPFTDDLFRDLDFNDDTFFDPFWFNLQF